MQSRRARSVDRSDTYVQYATVHGRERTKRANLKLGDYWQLAAAFPQYVRMHVCKNHGTIVYAVLYVCMYVDADGQLVSGTE